MVRALTLVTALVAALLVSACGGAPSAEKTKEPTVQDRPPMETIVSRYEALQADLFDQLERRFGPQQWALSPNNPRMGRAACGEDPEAETVSLPDMSFAGTYDSADWDDVRALVEQVGRAHGFDDVAVVVDEPGNLDLVGEDQYGGRYEFGMARNTIFGVKTGCHRWNQTPAPSP